MFAIAPTDIGWFQFLKQNKRFNDLNFTNEESGYILVDMDSEKLKKARMITDRKGQSSFKLSVSTAYNNKCCITGETIPELLEAAHIQPYINQVSKSGAKRVIVEG